MLDVLQTFVESRDYTFRRMDGATPIASRQPLINTFNQVHLFLAVRFFLHFFILSGWKYIPLSLDYQSGRLGD
jgi:hypothetical protein